MEDFREKLTEWYKLNYKEEKFIKRKDYFCPMLKQMCVGNDCAFWVSDADDDHHLGDHPCSINVIASHFLYQKDE